MPPDIACCAGTRVLLLGGALFLLSACDESEPPQDITLEFRGLVDGAPFACGERYEGIGTSEETFEPLDFRLYLHGFELIAEDGERVPVMPVADQRWQRDQFALVDFEDGSGACATGSPSMHTSVELSNDAGTTVAGVAFRIGLPPESNHLDAATAPAPLNEPGMWWSWNGGYKYVRADVRTAAGTPFYFHLGGTGCGGDVASGFSCGYPNISEIALTDFDPATEQITVDLARLYDGVDIMAPVDYAVDSVPGCMAFPGDPECPKMFAAIGLEFESSESAAAAQTMFGTEARP
jgi:uncharacterized repeat protein (TIGR04052 family)